MRLHRVVLVGVLAGCLFAPAQAGAVTYAQNFDTSAAGVTVTSGPGGLTYPLTVKTFDATGKTQSNPNALRRPGDCPNAGANCTTGQHRIEFVFEDAHKARTLSLRAGTVVPYSCFELDCPTMQLVGYNSSGAIVASTPVTSVGEATITRQMTIDAFAYSIKRAVFVVSGDPLTGAARPGDGHQYTAQVDNVTYDVFQGDPPPPPPPPAPTVSLTDPTAGEVFAGTDLAVSGAVNAPAGVANFCALANTTSFPTACDLTGSIRDDGAFSLFRIPGMRPGANRITVFVRDALGRTTSASVDIRVADGAVDFITESIEVTQAVQTEALPARTATRAPIPGLGEVPSSAYDGVPLARGRPTIARLYASASGAGGPVRGATAQLHGYHLVGGDLVEAPGSPLRPLGSPPSLTADPNLAALRAAADGSFNFVLPATWTTLSGLALVGTVAPTAPDALGDCCAANNSFALTQIPFTRTRSLTVYPVAANWTRASDGAEMRTPSNVVPLYDAMRTVFPGDTRIVPLPAIDVSDAANTELAKAEPSAFAIVDGVIAQLTELYGDETSFRGKVQGLIPGIGSGKGPGKIGATGSITASLDFIAHETGHQWGLAHAHAGTSCNDDNGDGAFDGPLSQRGPLLGVGLDPRYWSGGSVGRFRPIAPEKAGVFDATPDAPENIYDFMSYCSNEGIGTTWVSAPYWATSVRELASRGRVDTGFGGPCCFLTGAPDPTVRLRGSSGAERPVLAVSASIRLAGPPHRLLSVEQGSGTVETGPSEGGPLLNVIVKRADGSVISETPTVAEAESARTTGDDDVFASVHVRVPSAPDAARVEIRLGGILLLARDASSTEPRVKLTAPRSGAKIKRKGSFTAKWKASDADGDPLRSRLEYSADGGKSWRGLAVGLSDGKVKLSGADLPQASKGILRVTTADGFHTASDQVKGIRSQGSPPTAVITSPETKKLTIVGDGHLTLTGYGYTDESEPLGPKELLWRSGKRKLGTGATVDAPVYKLGRTVELIARDGKRTGSATLKLKVKKVAPVLTTLDAGKLTATATKVELELASSLPASLKIGGKGVKPLRKKIGTKARSFNVKLRGKKPSYTLKLSLAAAGKRSTTTVEVGRG